ncbi:MAG: hypothetical protein DCC75_04935, partial [Proteobacteria bacterium]
MQRQYELIACLVLILAAVSTSQGWGQGADSSDSSVSRDSKCMRAGELLTQAIALGDGSAAEENLYRKALSICPQMAEAQFNLGVLYFKRGDLPRAKESFELAWASKQEADYAAALGSVSLALGEVDAASKSFEKALALEPNSAGALQGLAVVEERRGDTNEAISYLKKALEKSPNNSLIHFNLGVMYERQNLMEEALNEYQNTIKLDDKNFHAHLQ